MRHQLGGLVLLSRDLLRAFWVPTCAGRMGRQRGLLQGPPGPHPCSTLPNLSTHRGPGPPQSQMELRGLGRLQAFSCGAKFKYCNVHECPRFQLLLSSAEMGFYTRACEAHKLHFSLSARRR